MQDGNTIMTPFNNPLMRFVSEPQYRWLRHSLLILIGLVLGFKGDIAVSGETRSPEMVRAFIILDTWTFFVLMGIIYLLILVLVPKLLFRSKLLPFIFSFFIIITFVYFFVWYVDYRFLKPLDTDPLRPMMQHVDLSFIAYIQYCAISSVLFGSVVGLVIFKKWINDVKQMNELHQVNLRTELEQLKSQVNPHFLFNTLNNLFVLMKTDTEKASQVLLGLSDLLRYQLYDSAKGQILLSKDIDFIHNLLELEKIRKNDFEYSIETEGHIDGVSLQPFLFIPFVENAIKHGTSTVGHSYLKLRFRIRDNHLYFYSENSKPPVKKSTIGGLGLGNIKRRLELLYPKNHTLDITEDAGKYIVNLILPI